MLRKLIDTIDVSKISHAVNAKDIATTNTDLLLSQKDTSSVITHDWLWPTIGTFFQPKDVIVTETGFFKITSLANQKDAQTLEFSTVGFRRT